MSVAAVEPTATRADILSKLALHNARAKRCPLHWVDRKAALHVRINELLTELEQVDAPPPS